MQFEKDGNLEEGNGIKETSLMLDITGDNINTLSLQNAEASHYQNQTSFIYVLCSVCTE